MLRALAYYSPKFEGLLYTVLHFTLNGMSVELEIIPLTQN
jgi:hypothetical protein